MKKRLLSMLLVLAMCAALLPTIALAGESAVGVSGEDDFFEAIDNEETSIILMDDFSLSERALEIDIDDELTLDLNGHTLTLDVNVVVNGTLTLIDSSKDGSGTIDASSLEQIQIHGTMNANGGTVSCLMTNAGILTKEASAKGTVFQAREVYTGFYTGFSNGFVDEAGLSAVISGGIFKTLMMNMGTISGGIFYNGINYYGNGKIDGYKITFMTDEETRYAEEVLSGAALSYEPDAPEMEDYTFGGWYLDPNGREKYTFGKPIEEDLTLYAKWKTGQETEEALTFAGVLSGVLTGAASALEETFVDVSRGAYYYKATKWAYENGIAGGVDSKHFAPDESCTRAQAVAMLWRAAGCPAVWTENPFEDVSANDYFYEAVLWAVANGITSGSDETHFSPDAPCTRGQIVTFLHRAERCYGAHESFGFVDVKSGSYCEDAINWAVENGITNGTDVGAFSPDAVCTRAQIVTFLYRNR